MIEIRFHGRGGQGIVMGAEILAWALFFQGKFVQYFPHFGVERRGAPVRAFLRIDDQKILLREQIYQPDLIVIFDQTLLSKETLQGLKREGKVLINSPKLPSHYDLGFEVFTINATAIARFFEIPVINTVMIGALAQILDLPFLFLNRALAQKFEDPRRNIGAAYVGWSQLRRKNE
jgi:2-oxoacid:acceptor oxidoreductase gamma subunit (pyruvate/2-ketoisovalerate family)